MKRDYDYFFKFVLIGDTCTGKSCLLVRFSDDDFKENYVTTIGVDFRFRTLQINKSTVRLQIWDTAGQERYRTITKAYYKGADGIMAVFDLTDKESFLNIDGWLGEIEKHCGSDVSIIVLANKCDVGQPQQPRQQPADTNGNEYAEEDDEQEREIEVTDEDIAQFEKAHNLKVLKTSAKSGQGVDEAFLEMTKVLIKKQNALSPDERKKIGGGKLGSKGLGPQANGGGKQGGGGCC
mmetsp:Transcript_17022/g.28761  ORF Transcript_17022/g.28761 Transcript_17022/m.28761 type:complete len:236 (-) Transcript_17022:56-763(-)